ncbi:MAG: peptidase S24 [Flavobacteriaceae bacterium CG_4_8_14_3_um_filter_34_10]|nr:peptidase S24 [Flavobacteriia bacterium]OIP50141.1 MAG: peptidase S24 [Flavobacteriaceae bacterium CG2_30_34_30]PIQ18978.1 MAG: peptidase S24 [Flavobacteriaceae bacterium CG18_big_fil_WC_8_21_14_2_50_34_36]PIV49431.1 MAG: peptidase S24 [Flavobacteriaceae bacterium CG02_land_8_20_14_3_00_34_13]PIX10730.1 MAG: peptidase S24 [Flavobacteriaceae bacterium CG_4_8_14_3_um_filter_34_10]PIZ08226.1 MAG: peptidase S24 [Flavobacteriaceae bacterium CG_4_10_14_0_8_um_filter_34_31]PJC08383.1 MAG: peptida
MQIETAGKLVKAKEQHRAEVSRQTGFPSAATHYAEPSIDLHKELVTNQDATFFIRIEGNELEYFQIHTNDVLLIDRSLSPKNGNLAVVVKDGDFLVIEINIKKLDIEYTLWGVITYIIHKVP